MRRRDWLAGAVAIAGAPAIVRSETARPKAAQGVMIGDVIGDVTAGARAMVWSRADRPSRMFVEYSTTESFREVKRVRGPLALPQSDFTTRVDLSGLAPDQEIFCRVQFESLEDWKTLSEPVTARFRTPPVSARRNVKFVWSGDTVGQGWGINPDWGGLRGYEAMRRRHPDFFIHSGDTIYADGPIQSEVRLPDGSLWKNVVTEAKSKVAETIDDFRGAYLYNFLDENVRRFHSEVPQIWQWDDHEVLNNWSPGKDLSKAPHHEKRIGMLVGPGTRAFLEYAPLRRNGDESERVYRRVPYGPLLDVFVLDMRSYRAANSWNRQPAAGPETDYMGRPQLEWLARGLAESKAAWKVIAADMPIGLLVGDGKDAQGRPMYEASANGDGPPLGRELEFSWLLSELKRRKVRNVIWITADTHYTAAHYYNPAHAQFTDFDPFWEFVSGPIHAGTFGPNQLDNTFGPEVRFQKHPPQGQSNLPPSAGMQFFGEVEIDARTREMEVRLLDIGDNVLFRQKLGPRA